MTFSLTQCAKISSEMAVQIIKNLQECEAQQSFCVMIAQTFLVQNWVRGLSADCGTKVSCNFKCKNLS